jgi:hypothetical protein
MTASNDAFLKAKFTKASNELGSMNIFDLLPYADDPGLNGNERRSLLAVCDKLNDCAERLKKLAREPDARR